VTNEKYNIFQWIRNIIATRRESKLQRHIRNVMRLDLFNHIRTSTQYYSCLSMLNMQSAMRPNASDYSKNKFRRAAEKASTYYEMQKTFQRIA